MATKSGRELFWREIHPAKADVSNKNGMVNRQKGLMDESFICG
jgi:hypothetical protein